jgi:GntR family transcriptional repressor for pyruvate dehydrogenase complex
MVVRPRRTSPSPPVDEQAVPSSEPRQKVPLRVARAIARHVAQERLPPGTMLETEQEMAQRFGIGRPSVREALRLLETQGLITLRRGVRGGPVVAAPSAVDLGQTMTMFLQMRSTPLRAVIVAGAELEALMASLATERVAKRRSIKPLRRALAAEERVVDREERLAAGINFHAELYRLANNEVLELLTTAVGGIVADRTRTYRHDHWEADERRYAYSEHVDLFDAVKGGDSTKAAEIARAHMLRQAERDLELHPDLADAIVDWR